MKTILCLTDDRVDAKNTAKSAVFLASALKANLFVFNTCADLPSSNSFGDRSSFVETLVQQEDIGKTKLKLLQSTLEDAVGHLDNQAYHPRIHTEFGEGPLQLSVTDILHKRNIELIVVGAETKSLGDARLAEEEINKIINFVNRPVLVIPRHLVLEIMTNLIFATDFNEEDHEAIAYLAGLGQKLNFHVEVIHINLIDEKDTVPFEKHIFLEKILSCRYDNVSFTEITSSELVKRLTKLSREIHAEVLAVMHRQHATLLRIFKHSVTREILSSQTMPVLVIPSDMIP